jgi:hypothetical protein
VDVRQVAYQFLRVSVPRRTNSTTRYVYLSWILSTMRRDCEHAFVAFRPYSSEIVEQFHVGRMG